MYSRNIRIPLLSRCMWPIGRRISTLSPAGSTNTRTCMWSLERARPNLEGSHGGRVNSLSISRTAFCSERTANRRKPCMRTTFAGSKLVMSIFPTGGAPARGGGRFTEWNCRMGCSKRSTIRMRTRFSPSSRGGTDMGGLHRDRRGGLGLIPRDRQNFLFVELLLFGVTVCLSAAGCQKKEETKPVSSAAAKSAVVVKISSESITAITPSAEFRLTPTGALTGTLVGVSGQTSLEDKPLDFSQIVSSSKKV